MLRFCVSGAILLICGIAACGGEGQTDAPPTGTGTAQGGSGAAASGGSGAASQQGGGGSAQTSSGGSTSDGGSGGSSGGSGGAGGNASGGAGGAGGGTNGELGDPCTHGNDECQPGLYCDASGCGAGLCADILNTAAQTPTYDPVCGCDGINYFNATIAESHGAAVSHAGVCAANEEVACDTDSAPCGVGQSCSVQVANSGICGPSLSAGVCWGAPVTCGTGQPMARGCIPPGDCANKCALIRSQNAWYEDVSCN